MNKIEAFTAQELKWYILKQIEIARKEHSIPLKTIAHIVRVDTAEQMLAYLDPQNTETSLEILVRMSHAVGLRMHIQLE